jgi:hypothetical protein
MAESWTFIQPTGVGGQPKSPADRVSPKNSDFYLGTAEHLNGNIGAIVS